MAITVRKGSENQFDVDKMLPGEFAVATDTGKVFVCTSAGKTKELASVEELKNILDTSDEAFNALRELIGALEEGSVVTGILNDINGLKSGEYTITFSEASEISNIESTDTLKVILGKIKKFLSSFSAVAFSGNYSDLSEKPELAEVATSGSYKDLKDVPEYTAENISYDNSTSRLNASSVQGAIDEVNDIAKNLKSDIEETNETVEGIAEDLSAVGQYYAATVSADVSVESKKGTAVASLQLPKGTYVLTGGVRFAANGTGNRYLNISSSSGGATNQVNGFGNASLATQLNIAMCVKLNADTTLYLNAYQDSGSTLNCVSGGIYFRAIRIG